MNASVASHGRIQRRGLLMVLVLMAALSAVLAPTPTSAITDPCGPQGNPISCENSKPGTPRSTWSITGSGDSNIQGFATDMSVNHGTTVRFKVKTPATSYRLDIYRMGYYGGDGARKVASVLPTATLPQAQPSCLFDSTTRLVDCGNWAESASWAVPADAVSGIYFVNLVRTDGAKGSGVGQIFFVVRADEQRSDILYQTSDTTWQAYNRYGGYSLYYGSPSRAYKVSYNRPFITRDCCDESFVFSAEYPMVRWMEANGYDVTYSSGVDTDRAGAALLNHTLFMSSGHDEYWSAGQRANVEAARDAGVNLAFFSGNEVFWKTRWESSIDGSATTYRTLVTYKETQANAEIDPSPAWTGTWRDRRFNPPDAGRPENQLTGTLFTVNCCASTAEQEFAITVPEALGKTRMWRNTAAATLAPGAVATLSSATLGYEWDEDVDNGFRPAGLIHYSSTTESVSQHLADDWGNSFAPGDATHHLTLYKAPSGALVFGAGTIRWSWGLDTNHDSATSVADPIIRQATVNVLADLGAQPTTLQPGLVPATKSTDTTAPTATITAPLDRTAVTADHAVVVSGTASDVDGVVAGVEVSTDNGTTWHPAAGTTSWTYTWTPATVGQARVIARAMDDSANIGANTPARSLSVMRLCPCSTWNTSPTPGVPASTDASANEVGMKFQTTMSGFITGVRFFKGSGNTGTHVGHVWSRTGTLLGTVQFSNESATGWQQANFATPIAVTANTTYVVSYYAPNGHYASDVSYFATAGVDSSPVRALAQGADGNNGVYRYASSGFPTLSYKSSNYWVDVVFNMTPPPAPASPTATAVSATQVDVSWADVATETNYVIQSSPDGSTGWADVGAVSQNVVTFSHVGLLPDTDSWYRVVAVNPGGMSAPSPAARAHTPAQPPATPTGLSASAVSSTEIDLSWTGVTAQTGYVVERSTDATTWSVIASPTSPSYVDAALTPSTTYWYRVRAVNGSGGAAASSDPSTPVSATTLAALPVPGTPSGLAATTTSSQVSLTWNDVDDETSYSVERSATAGGGFVPIGTTAADVTSYVDADDIDPSSTWYYRVIAVGPGGASAPSAVLTATTLPDPPAVPTGLAVVGVSTTQVTLGWDATPSADSYGVERSVDGVGGWTPVGTPTTPTYTDAGLDPATTYWYRVIARNAGGVSGASSPVSATTTAELTPPAAPNDVSVTAATTTSLTLAWTSPAGADTFVVERSGDGAGGWVIVSTQATSGYTDNGLTPATPYWYRVTAANAAGSSPPSAAVTGTTDAIPVPSAPTGLTVTGSTSSSVALSWSSATGATAYRVERVSGSTWTPVGTTASTSYTDTSVVPGTAYSYRVVATNAGGDSPPSSTVSTTTPIDPPATPTFVTAAAVSASQISVRWSSVAGATSYVVQRSPDGTTNWTSTATLTATSTTIDLLPADTTQYVRVIASNSAGSSTPSAVASTRTLPRACPCTIFTAASQPASSPSTDATANELGVKFRVAVNGTITGIRFYKGTANTGVHVGHLWARTGTLLATATFQGESASGWQEVSFSTPVAVTAGTTYVASYYAPNGRYAQDINGFASSGAGTAPLTALASGVDGNNGVYAAGSAFPKLSFRSSNYWVDVVFAASAPATVTGLATSAVTSSTITMSWSAAANAAGYRIERSADGVTGWALTGSTTAGVTTFTDGGLPPSTRAYYRVVAINSGGSAAPSSVVVGTTAP